MSSNIKHFGAEKILSCLTKLSACMLRPAMSLLLLSFAAGSLGCSMDASLTEVKLASGSGSNGLFLPLSNGKNSQVAEMVTTSTTRGASIDGYTINANFIETAESVTTTTAAGGAAGYTFENIGQ